jgi:hypothetical protein
MITALATAAAIAVYAAPAAAQVTVRPNQDFTAGETDSGGYTYATNEHAYFNVVDPGADAMGPITATFGHEGIPSTSGSSLIDHFLFTILDNGYGSGSVTTSVSLAGIGGVTDTDILNVWINGVLASHTTATAQSDQWDAMSVPIFYGVQNDLAIEFVSRGLGHYAGTAEFTPAAVPEPATWAMMLLGFGGIGFAMRKKKKTALPQFA